MLNCDAAQFAGRPVPPPGSARLAELIRQAIRYGSPPPGGHLSEYELARRYDTSRTPVRHALTLLALQDLAVYREHRGYFVRDMDPQEIQGRLRIRAAMEGLAARIVASRGITVAERCQLRAARAECVKGNAVSMNAEGFTDYMRAVEQFHEVLRAGADNPLLGETIRRAIDIPFRFANGRIRWIEHERLATWAAMPRAISAANLDRARVLDAIEERNGPRAESMTREHFFSMSQTIALLFSAKIAAPAQPPDD
ncbi:MAG: GntR family transcriptional regulator [Gammaproteobacteria bacterium]|nr:GntR family transcriptional regulator [Gammaproteobacteria bacterium]